MDVFLVDHRKRRNSRHGDEEVEQNASAREHAEDLHEGDIREHVREERSGRGEGRDEHRRCCMFQRLRHDVSQRCFTRQ